jgi:hypothetical protein
VTAQGGRLQQVREDARSAASTPSSDSSSSAAKSSSDANDDSILGALLAGLLAVEGDNGNSDGGMVLAYTVIAPFYLPAAALGDRYRDRLYFAPHPYAGVYPGFQLLRVGFAEIDYTDGFADVPRRHWSVRLAMENGNDFTGLNRVGGQLKIEHTRRWGITSNWNWFHEKLGCGCTDETLLGDTNITFRFAQNEIASMYTGLGFRMLTDRRQTDYGFNFTYGGDWFPVRPIVVSANIDAGTLGHAGVFHARCSVGAIWRGVEVYGGYDFLRIGATNLQGPMAGVRFWF